MATLKSIKRRISAVGNTKKLTRAMKMIAAARLRRAQTRALEARLFNKEINRLLAEMVKHGAKLAHPLIDSSKGEKEVPLVMDLIVFTSDRGLCGAFNEGLLKKTVNFIREKEKDGYSVQCTVFGRKGRDFLKREKCKIAREFVHLSGSEIRNVLNAEVLLVTERYLNAETAVAVIVFNRFNLGGGQDTSFQTLLPVTPPQMEPEYCIDYIYEPQATGVLQWLIDQIIKSNLFQAYLESSAGELAARMVAMDMATRNAEELTNILTMKYNRERQAAITRELMDIVGGAEALK